MDQTKLPRDWLCVWEMLLVVGELDASKVLVTSTSRFKFVRQTLAQMLEKGTEYWVQSIPTLYQVSQTSSYEARAEAAYLIAQINTSLGLGKRV